MNQSAETLPSIREVVGLRHERYVPAADETFIVHCGPFIEQQHDVNNRDF